VTDLNSSESASVNSRFVASSAKPSGAGLGGVGLGTGVIALAQAVAPSTAAGAILLYASPAVTFFTGLALYYTQIQAIRPPADSQRPAPCHPHPHNPTWGVAVTRHHHWFTHVHPFGLPLTCDTRSERAPLGFPPGFAPGHH
jgi:hypothetical protein